MLPPLSPLVLWFPSWVWAVCLSLEWGCAPILLALHTPEQSWLQLPGVEPSPLQLWVCSSAVWAQGGFEGFPTGSCFTELCKHSCSFFNIEDTKDPDKVFVSSVQ